MGKSLPKSGSVSASSNAAAPLLSAEVVVLLAQLDKVGGEHAFAGIDAFATPPALVDKLVDPDLFSLYQRDLVIFLSIVGIHDIGNIVVGLTARSVGRCCSCSVCSAPSTIIGCGCCVCSTPSTIIGCGCCVCSTPPTVISCGCCVCSTPSTIIGCGCCVCSTPPTVISCGCC